MAHMSKRGTHSRLDHVNALETVWLPLVTCLSFEDQLALLVYAYDDDLDELAVYLESQQRFPRDLVMDVAVAHGCVRTLKRFLRVEDVRLSPGLAHATTIYVPSVLNNRTCVMRWLNRYRPRVYCEEAMMMAAQRGDLELVQWLHTTCVYDVEAAMCSAAKRGHLGVAQWLGDNLSSALPTGSKKSIAVDVEILIRLYSAVSDGRVLYWAIRRGEDITRWFCVRHDHGEEPALVQKSTDGAMCHDALVMDALSFAVSLGDKQLMKQIYADKTLRPERTEALAVAARRGDLAVVQWLRSDCGYGIPLRTMVEAAIGGNTALIEWLHESCGISPDCYGMLYAGCKFGHLEVVQWVCSHCPDLMLDPVRWAQACCPELKQKELQLVQNRWVEWNLAEAYRMIDQSGESAERVRQVLEWLLSVYELEIKRESGQLMLNVAIACGSVTLLETLPLVVGYHEQGMAFTLAGELGRMDVLTSILSRLRGRNEIEQFFRQVSKTGSREIMEVLLRTHPQYCNFMPSRGVFNLVRKGHLEMAQKHHRIW
ncbi:hypothetical protein Poli38472_000106 [Pythium oligandrum]|uniref:Ankyrin repeat-containing domain n=1 Tax=Pythium oligandrum TaxID=41045 RepID=A0A8K1CBM5_PYTOL|nr:hypothetical protein Poli38472_000106 [Pythium oligandrum]|eukprot:TMW60064.1 hypothetical protein Poli38472_000106 [Pythium oligandrum]